MNYEQQRKALGALGNASDAVVENRPLAAEQWAESAATLIREANLSAAEAGRLVAPRGAATVGDVAAIVLSACALVWIVVSQIAGASL